MKAKWKTSAILLVFFALFCAQAEVPEKGLAAIDTVSMRRHLAFLSGDEMKGRDTPSPELHICGDYIADYFNTLGLKAGGENNSYFQTYNIINKSLSEPNRMELHQNGKTISFAIKDDFVPLEMTANQSITAPVVFAGYGITAPEYEYDDYKNIDVKDKIVFIFTCEPQEEDTCSIFKGADRTKYSRIGTKVETARENGAAGMIIVTDPNNHVFRRPPNTWPSLMRTPPADAAPVRLEESKENEMVIVRIGKECAEAIFASSGKRLSDIQTQIDSDLIPRSFYLPDITITLETRLHDKKTPVRNVAGLWEGSDPDLKNEYILIGAHYDHLGALNDTIIFNGADDNASGTAGVMALAKAFASAEVRPKRSIVFLAWSGEEKGLFGSNYYVNTSPVFPLEQTVTYLNMDMIGRNDTSFVNISGIHSADIFEQIIKNAQQIMNLQINTLDRVSRSDHAPFYLAEIPVLGFNSGFHDDYHKATDTIEKIDFNGMKEICDLIFRTAWVLSELDERPIFYQNEEVEMDE